MCIRDSHLVRLAQLHNDGTGLGRLLAVNEAFGLRQVHHQIDFVELFETLLFGTDDLQRSHVGRTTGIAGQHFDSARIRCV